MPQLKEPDTLCVDCFITEKWNCLRMLHQYSIFECFTPCLHMHSVCDIITGENILAEYLADMSLLPLDGCMPIKEAI